MQNHGDALQVRVLWRCSGTQSTAYHPAKGTLPRAGQVTPVPAQPPAWQQTNPPEKQGIFFFSVGKLIWLVGKPGECKGKVEAAERLEEETLLFQHLFMRSVQCIHSPSCSPGKAFFSPPRLWKEPRETSLPCLSLPKYPSHCLQQDLWQLN